VKTMELDVAAPAATELRCRCHRLLARLDDKQVLLRCPRCKQEAVLAWTPNAPQGNWITLKL